MTNSSHTVALTLTPEQFLESSSKQYELTRQYVGHSLLSLGMPLFGTAFFMENQEFAVNLGTLGSAYTIMGAATLVFKSQMEKKYKEMMESPHIAPIEFVKEIRDKQQFLRHGLATFSFVFSGLYIALGIYTGERDIVLSTTGFIVFGIDQLLSQTPLEIMCNEIIKYNTTDSTPSNTKKSPLSLQLSPSLNDVKLGLTYRFN